MYSIMQSIGETPCAPRKTLALRKQNEESKTRKRNNYHPIARQPPTLASYTHTRINSHTNTHTINMHTQRPTVATANTPRSSEHISRHGTGNIREFPKPRVSIPQKPPTPIHTYTDTKPPPTIRPPTNVVDPTKAPSTAPSAVASIGVCHLNK